MVRGFATRRPPWNCSTPTDSHFRSHCTLLLLLLLLLCHLPFRSTLPLRRAGKPLSRKDIHIHSIAATVFTKGTNYFSPPHCSYPPCILRFRFRQVALAPSAQLETLQSRTPSKPDPVVAIIEADRSLVQDGIARNRIRPFGEYILARRQDLPGKLSQVTAMSVCKSVSTERNR